MGSICPLILLFLCNETIDNVHPHSGNVLILFCSTLVGDKSASLLMAWWGFEWAAAWLKYCWFWAAFSSYWPTTAARPMTFPPCHHWEHMPRFRFCIYDIRRLVFASSTDAGPLGRATWALKKRGPASLDGRQSSRCLGASSNSTGDHRIEVDSHSKFIQLASLTTFPWR